MSAAADDLYAFDVTVQARPAEARVAGSHVDDRGAWPALEVPRAALSAPLGTGFDTLLDRLAALERMYVEPDGSFVWTSPREGPWWQVDGNAAERDGRVLLVDVRGSCPPAAFDRLLACLGWPATPLMFQLVRPAVFLDEATFRRHALARGTAGDGETLRPR
ncbi:MAG: hypothetical protein ACKOZU_11990 [Planctomycetaceae bacterium]